MAAVTVLDIEIYEVGEAARLLGVHARTLRNWLDGYTARGKTYPPVLREQSTGSDLLTWGEFVEAGFLKEYRSERVPLPEIRSYVDAWRDRLGVKYPLAHQQPFTGADRHLMDLAKADAGDNMIYRFLDNQLVLAPWSEDFVKKVEFDHNVATRYWPAGQDEAVVIDPKRSFGAPTVDGIRTEILYEMFAAGDQMDEIADGYDLDRGKVEAAVRYESSRARRETASSAA